MRNYSRQRAMGKRCRRAARCPTCWATILRCAQDKPRQHVRDGEQQRDGHGAVAVLPLR